MLLDQKLFYSQYQMMIQPERQFSFAPFEFLRFLGGVSESETDKGTLSYGLDAVAGLEYKFNKLPIAVSVDWQPGYALNAGGGFGSKGGGFGVKYTF